MNAMTTKKMEYIDALAQADAVYAAQMQKYRSLEKQFDHMTAALDDAQRSLAWDFVMACEDMSLRKLELACMHMEPVSEGVIAK